MSRLSRWLMYAVHGERRVRARRRRRFTQTRGPARDPRYRAWIRTLPCLVCRRYGSEAAHTGDDGGMSLKASDYSCVPLCADDHTLRPDSYHRHPGGRDGFEAQHQLNLAQQVRFLNLEWREAKWR